MGFKIHGSVLQFRLDALEMHKYNKKPFVSDEKRERVERVIEEMWYRPNALARSLRSGETNTIGLILPDSANPYFDEVGRTIEMAAFDAGYSVILCNTENDLEREHISWMCSPSNKLMA